MRRLRVLVDRLPPESATNTAVRERYSDAELKALADARPEGSYGPWSRLDYWLAGLADRVDQLIYALVTVNGAKVDAPKPTPRPGLVTDNADGWRAPDPGLMAEVEARRQARKAAAQAGCGCPPPVLEAGRHLASCAHRTPVKPPEEGGAT